MKTIKIALIALCLGVFSTTVQAQIAPVDDNGLAIGGYDVVAYFSGTAKKGFEAYSTKHNNVQRIYSINLSNHIKVVIQH